MQQKKKKKQYGWVSCKGSDSTLLIRWLKVFVQGLLFDPIAPEHIPTLKRIQCAATSALACQNLLYQHGAFLHRHCAAVLYQEIHEFLKQYNALAFVSMHSHDFPAFGIKSKYHLIAHAKEDIRKMLGNRSTLFVPSPMLFSCEQNEDVIGKVARLSRKVNTRKTTSRTLEHVLIKSCAVHRKWFKKTFKSK